MCFFFERPTGCAIRPAGLLCQANPVPHEAEKGLIEPEHLPPDVFRPAEPGRWKRGPVGAQGKRPGPDEIREALEKSGGKKVEAARLLGISRVTLWKRLKEYAMEGS